MRATLRRFGLAAVKAVASVSSLDLKATKIIITVFTLVAPGERGDQELPGNSPGESNSKQANLGVGESSSEQVGSSVCECGSEKVGVGSGEGGGKGVLASFSQGNPEKVTVHSVGEGCGQQVGLCLSQGNL